MKGSGLLVVIATLAASGEQCPVKKGAAFSSDTATASSPTAGIPAPATQEPRGKTPMTSAPFEIRLTTSVKGLRATLKNVSATPQPFLHNSSLQPSMLHLVGPDGKPVRPFDSRSIKKFDNTVYAESFAALDAGQETLLFQTAGTGGQLRWGPYQWTALSSGTYTAMVVFVSAIDSYQDRAGTAQKKPGVWLGSVTSNEVTFELP